MSFPAFFGPAPDALEETKRTDPILARPEGVVNGQMTDSIPSFFFSLAKKENGCKLAEKKFEATHVK